MSAQEIQQKIDNLKSGQWNTDWSDFMYWDDVQTDYVGCNWDDSLGPKGWWRYLWHKGKGHQPEELIKLLEGQLLQGKNGSAQARENGNPQPDWGVASDAGQKGRTPQPNWGVASDAGQKSRQANWGTADQSKNERQGQQAENWNMPDVRHDASSPSGAGHSQPFYIESALPADPMYDPAGDPWRPSNLGARAASTSSLQPPGYFQQQGGWPSPQAQVPQSQSNCQWYDMNVMQQMSQVQAMQQSAMSPWEQL